MTTVAKLWHYLSERRTAESQDAPAPAPVHIKQGKRTADRLVEDSYPSWTYLGPIGPPTALPGLDSFLQREPRLSRRALGSSNGSCQSWTVKEVLFIAASSSPHKPGSPCKFIPVLTCSNLKVHRRIDLFGSYLHPVEIVLWECSIRLRPLKAFALPKRLNC